MLRDVNVPHEVPFEYRVHNHCPGCPHSALHHAMDALQRAIRGTHEMTVGEKVADTV